MTDTISKHDDFFDIRTAIEEYEELETELEDAHEREDEGIASFEGWLKDAAENSKHTLQDAAQRFTLLKDFLADVAGNGGDHQWRGDWYPVTFVRDSYFEDFAQETAEQLDLIKADATWPNNCIDWEQAARELQMDYSSCEFDGVTFWYR